MKSIDNYLITIYEERNITKAAHRLGISQPALSAALTKLERELGYSIFHRNSSPLSLTNEGEIYIRYIKKSSLLEKNLLQDIAELHNVRNRRLCIGATSAYIKPIILPAVSQLISYYPDCDIKISEGTLSSLSEKALNGEIDIFLSTTSNISSDFILTEVFDEQIYLCTHKPILLSPDGTPDWSTLATERFIRLGESQPLQTQVDLYLSKAKFVPSRVIEVNQISSAVDLVTNKCGFCFATGSSLYEHLDNTTLSIHKLPKVDFPRTIYLATFKYQNTNELQVKFTNIIRTIGETQNEKL